MRREGRLAGVTGRTCAAVVVAAVVTAGCGRVPDGPAPARSTSAAAPGKDGNLAPAPEATPLPAGLAPITAPFRGDLDQMVKRRLVRVLTVQNPILYSVDRGREIGLTYEVIKAFEARLNQQLGNDVVRAHI